jgi:hypothetical protein
MIGTSASWEQNPKAYFFISSDQSRTKPSSQNYWLASAESKALRQAIDSYFSAQ